MVGGSVGETRLKSQADLSERDNCSLDGQTSLSGGY